MDSFETINGGIVVNIDSISAAGGGMRASRLILVVRPHHYWQSEWIVAVQCGETMPDGSVVWDREWISGHYCGDNPARAWELFCTMRTTRERRSAAETKAVAR